MKALCDIRDHAQQTMDWAERQGADVSDLRDEFNLYTNEATGERTMYQQTIKNEADAMGIDVDPRHVEAWMRLEYSTLDARTKADFRRFIREVPEIEKAEPGASESLAKSYGL